LNLFLPTEIPHLEKNICITYNNKIIISMYRYGTKLCGGGGLSSEQSSDRAEMDYPNINYINAAGV
jgi:hypothetical protein